MARLNGKVAVVTGGANGLGAAIAARLAEEGAAVAILDRDERGQDVAEKLTANGAKAIFRSVDVTSEDRVSSSLASVVEELGSITVLVNNAGIEGVNKPTDQLDLADWEKVMAVNSTAVFLCTKHVIPHMRAAGHGSIVNISSIYGILGGADIPPYHASKGAVRAMSKNDALTYAPENIRVNSVHPGFIFTDMVHRYASEAGLSEADARGALDPAHPLGGTGDPDDIAWGVVYLASDQAKWVTGSELVIDGGYTAR
ncbi:SDR family NAD(P)-dependent oxidoreductase [Pseudonocardia abyssalis]|jgi:NAD(P)-dependent dehydrogenase (short-subunit alcohol dehydrogenase family)|uniref:Glucose 1-dehydrogenase n=1 Tax=Pseudonocardia abyssalis TaxID=2792008 RepID=A0ABS6UVL3_9PSEU|nr:glucose 1-dehydrogenase [Pseudonocardia abyssalis]MBW0114758.1 glucose 1-dehydrogenase [Pseudonocardia abyssalis]MBW0136300.1 glucose 1-dehydrogenase [Pseudonocardia abyssalis]